MSGPPKPEFFLDGYRSGTQLIWDIRRPQKFVASAYERGLLTGKILDVGCGLCENAIYLAAQENVKEVTAVDFSPDALRQAEERITAAELPNPSKLRTLVADVMNLKAAFGEETFDTVLDSAMLHCFNPGDQRRYIESLTPHVKVGGGMFLVAFSDENPDPWAGPARLSKSELHQLFNPKRGWAIKSIGSTEYEMSAREVRGGPVRTGHAYQVQLERVAVESQITRL